LPPTQHDKIWSVQKPLNFPDWGYGFDRDTPDLMIKITQHLSAVLAALGCVFAGLCYAELASLIPIAGSGSILITGANRGIGRALVIGCKSLFKAWQNFPRICKSSLAD
jgi:hypothetical protein